MSDNLSFVLVSLINAYAFMEAMTNLLLFSFRKINKYCIFFYVFLCQYVFGQQLGQYITYFTIVGVILIVALSSRKDKHYITNCALSLFGYLFAILINYLILTLLNLLGITIADIYANSYYLIIFVIIYTLITCFMTRYVGKFLRKALKKHNILFSKELQQMLSLEIILCTIIFIFNIVQGEQSGYPSQIIYINTILFGAFFIITLIIFIYCLRIMQKNHELQTKQRERESLEDYMRKLEDLYQNIRIFKHDYLNILSTMKCYIDNDNPEQLREYFQSKILPTSSKLEGKDAILGKLSNIKLLELKGILYTKLIIAMNLDLNITLEIQEEINSVSMEMLDLCTIIGIYMDNAIEASKESEKKDLVVAVINGADSVLIIISNSTSETNICLDQINKEDVTTKPNHSGLGLHNANAILAKYGHIIHTTTHEDKTFTQKLEICKR